MSSTFINNAVLGDRLGMIARKAVRSGRRVMSEQTNEYIGISFS